jgi:diguanylate cyclase (GGDEF)-like protein
MTAKAAYTIGLARMRRVRSSVVAAIALVILLAALATAIVLSHDQARSQIDSSFELRGTSSARFVATYVDQQASRQREVARRALAASTVDPARFKLIVGALGSGAATLRDDRGRALDSIPPATSAVAAPIAAQPRPTPADDGGVSISGVIFAPDGSAGTAIATPFSSATGQRTLTVDYPGAELGLDALVDHVISYPEHEVFVVDSAGRVLAASPRTLAETLSGVDPHLAGAIARASHGEIQGAREPSAFTATPIPGTAWRLLIAVPNSRLYASITGWTQLIPWLVFALVTVLGALLVALFARSLADRSRLTALSAAMERTAQTDSLTGLYNRRALTEQLTRSSARARRHDEPLSVLMIDLDRFKQINDTFGHEAGDQVLCTIADCLRDVLRADDIYGRWGGDEFLVALPKTGSNGAEVTAERLRATAAAIKLADIGLPDGVQISVGVACGVHASQHDLVREADLALYRAKAMLAPTGELAPR